MRIYIWGAGTYARQVFKSGLKYELSGFVETIKCKNHFEGKNVFSPDEIKSNYDTLIVAIKNTKDIQTYLSNNGFDFSRILFMSGSSQVESNLELAKKILSEENLGRYIGLYNLIEESFFFDDKKKYHSLNKRLSFAISDENDYPIITDKYDEAGTVNNYFWQDLWAAKLIFMNKPKQHYDIGSRLDGFIAHVLTCGIPVSMVDIRPFPEEIEGLETIVDDATQLNMLADESVDSLSALCSLEHFGLGRYGDPIDPEACFVCFENIQKKLAKNGHLYISVPIGEEKVLFNAHRVFFASTIVKCFHKLSLVEFSCTFGGKLEKNIDIYKYDNAKGRGERYGLFHFVKK